MHAVIHAVLAESGGSPATGCLFFALAGAYLMSEVHRLPATVHVGTAFYAVGGDPPNVLMFARFVDDIAVADPAMGRFHAWVECGEWVIDLMAPVFHENASAQGLAWSIPRRRFQKHLDAMAPQLEDIEAPGTFGVVPNTDLRAELMEPLSDAPATLHMVSQCLSWYRRPPTLQPDLARLPHFHGGVQMLRLPSHRIEGDW